ncbi:major capsid protein [Oceanibaculum nanhaiense]|uniref:major capsid protein n=1 Tax=Oceanibaculum nanhaiense TaxID=1909734 RepID=UPI003D29F7E8
MASMDIFNQDAFSMVSLTQAIQDVDYLPTLLGDLNVFEDDPVTTEAVAIEKRGDSLALIQTSERGTEIAERNNNKRDIRYFRTPRIAKGDTIYASEIQNIRAFGTETELERVQAEIARRMAGPSGLMRDMALTHEYMRLGAVQGILLDADGSVIYNWFTEWGINQPAEIDFELDDANTNVRAKCNAVVRAMAKAGKGTFIPNLTQVHSLTGDEMFDKLIDHPSVRDTYTGWAAAEGLREGTAYRAFPFGGILWHNYRGTDDGTTIAVPSTKAKFFPVNAPGVFKRALAPAETFDFVNTPGLPQYAMIVRDQQRNMWARPEVYSYPLYICTKPGMLQRAKMQ